MPELRYDAEVDAAYLPVGDIAPGESRRQVIVALPDGIPGEVILDFDEAGHLLGVELLGASALLRDADRGV